MKDRPLRVVHLCTSDRDGGAAIAAHRLVVAQRAQGIEAHMLVLHQAGDEPFVHALLSNKKFARSRSLLNKYSEALLSALCCGKLRGYRLFVLSIPFFGFNLLKHPLCRDADILHFHYTNQGFISLRTLRLLALAEKKIVFTLHDIWHVAAICHYTPDTHTKGFELATPYASNFIARGFARYVFRVKKRLYHQLRPSFVGCSQWIAGVASRSRLTEGCSICSIPNIPDTLHFRPLEKQKARSLWQLPLDRPLILYGAANTRDERKGYKEMKASINLLANSQIVKEKRPLLVVFGKFHSSDFSKEELGIEARCLGYIDSPKEMATLYAACDLFLTTALEENFPNTIIEAQLCNCPTVAFAVGGIPEIVTSEEEGYLAKPYDTKEIATALEKYIARFPNPSSSLLSTKARQRYQREHIVGMYRHVYQDKLLT